MKRPGARLWFSVHGWIGAQLGVLLFVILFSGTLATVSHEIDWLLNPALRVAPQETHASWGALYAAAQSAYPEAHITELYAPLGPRFAAQVWIELPIEGEFFEQHRRVYVNPYTAEVQGVADWFTVQRVLRNFHMMLSLPAPLGVYLGVYLVGAFGIVLLASMLTALLFYKHWWRHFLLLRWNKGWKIFWSDAHRTFGLWSLWFTLIIALTGIWYSVELAMHDLDRGLQDAPQSAPMLSAKQLARYGDAAARLPLDELITRVHEAYPGLEIAAISLPSDPRGAVDFTGHANAWLVRPSANRVFLNPYDGSVMAIHKGEELPLIYRWVHTADPLHFGDFGGLVTKLIWFVFGLASSGLTLTGAYLWCKRSVRKAKEVRTNSRQLARPAKVT